jgi:hypothetical protein
VFAHAGWPYLGGDLGIYMDATHRWLGGGGWYLPFQLTGPYPVLPPVVLYPPHWLVVLVPFALGLPAILWWLVPAAAVAWSLDRLRPAWWSWPLILGCCVWPRSVAQVLYGNPVIWVAAAAWLGAVYGWPAALVALKPTLAPFALLGARRRSWWLLGALLAIVSLPLLVDYLTVLLNARGGGFLYSVEEWPLVAAPVLARVAQQRPTALNRAASGRRCIGG